MITGKEGLLQAMIEVYAMEKGINDIGTLTLALEMERRAHNLYKTLSEKADDANTRAFMKEMMHGEEKHIEYLKQLKYRIPESY